MKQKEFLAQVDSARIVASIEAAERRCSGEIRVHVEPSLHGRDVRFMAERTFERLGMTKTELRNGVLIFLAAKEQSFAIIGDKGIHEKVGEEFWRLVAAHLTEHFQKKEFTEGIVDAVNEVGEQLATFFPHAGAGDRNELSNEISTGQS